MVRSTSTAMCAVLAAASSAALAAAPDLIGHWSRGDGNAQIQIAPCEAKLCATNTWIRDTSKGEAVGDKLVLTLEPTSESVLRGKAFDQKRDLTFSLRISVDPPGKMTTSGCVLLGLLCKTENWTRIR